MGTETRAQALRGAPGAKTPQIEGSGLLSRAPSGMRATVTGLPRVPPLWGLFPAVRRRGNKRGASLVSAAAVIPAPRVVGVIIGPKAAVAGPASPP